jgi:hypothetical protein
MDIKPLKQFLIPLENLLQGIYKQTFAKTPGTRQKEASRNAYQTVSYFRFVHIDAIIFPQHTQSVDSQWEIFGVHTNECFFYFKLKRRSPSIFPLGEECFFCGIVAFLG